MHWTFTIIPSLSSMSVSDSGKLRKRKRSHLTWLFFLLIPPLETLLCFILINKEKVRKKILNTSFLLLESPTMMSVNLMYFSNCDLMSENSAVTVIQCRNVCWVQMGYLIIMMLFSTWPSSAHSVYCAYRSHTLLTTAEQIIYTATVQIVHHSSVSGSAAVKEFFMWESLCDCFVNLQLCKEVGLRLKGKLTALWGSFLCIDASSCEKNRNSMPENFSPSVSVFVVLELAQA